MHHEKYGLHNVLQPAEVSALTHADFVMCWMTHRITLADSLYIPAHICMDVTNTREGRLTFHGAGHSSCHSTSTLASMQGSLNLSVSHATRVSISFVERRASARGQLAWF